MPTITSTAPCAVVTEVLPVKAPAATAVAGILTTQDVEWLHLCDDTASDGVTVVPFVRRLTTEAGVVSVANFGADGISAYNPVGTVGVCASAVEQDFQQVVKTCMVDDVNSNNTLLVPYVAVTLVSVDTAGVVTTTDLGDYTDGTMATVYATLGITLEATDVGTDAIIKQGRIEVEAGNIWSPSELTQSYTVRVVSVGVTYTDSAGIVTDMALGEVSSWAGTTALFDLTPVITTDITGKVVITYTELGA